MNGIEKIKKCGLKQKEIAEILGVSDATLSGILSGKRKPTKSTLKLIEAYFGERKPYINPKIEAVARIMEELDPAAQDDLLHCAEKEKRIVEMMKQCRSEKMAA